LRKTVKRLGYGEAVTMDDDALQPDELDENILETSFLPVAGSTGC